MSDNRIFRPLLWPTILTLAALAVLIGLGKWQLDRLQWKLHLIETINERMAASPVDVPDEAAWQGLDVQAMEYRHLRLVGRFLHDKEVHYFTKNDKGQPGYDIVTPLALASGGIVFVDRGFVSEALKQSSTRAEGQADGVVKIIGVARPPQSRESFTPPDDVAANIWFTRDPARMGESVGLSGVAPFFVEVDASPNPGGWPLGGQTHVNIRNEHLNYALTWFGLAAALIGVYLAYHWKNGRIGNKP